MAATASLALMGASAASSAIGSYYSAKGQQTALRYQADIAETNARIAEVGAQSALVRGQREEQASRLRTAQLKGRQRASLAANGVDLGEGSSLDILDTTDMMGEIDAQTIKSNAVMSAWGYRTQGANLQAEALVTRSNASSINPGMSAVTSLLGSSGQVASSWYSMNKGSSGKRVE